MHKNHPSLQKDTFSWGILLSFVFLKFLIHLLSITVFAYGIFRDELYYLACASRPAIGYVDHPPLSIWILNVNRLLLGDSLTAIRLLPALLGAATVFMAGLIVRELKGGRTALVLTGISITLCPIILSMNSLYSLNSLDIFFWTLAAWVLIKLYKTPEPKLWILTGFILGLGLLNKISMGWFVLGFGAVILLTNLRTFLKTKWPYITAVIVLLCFSPYLIWNMQHNFAHLEFMSNAVKWKYGGMNPLIFLSNQFLLMSPFGFILWLLGLIGIVGNKGLKPYRPIAVVGLTTMAILIINWHSKPEYLSPTIPMMMAGGALLAEQTFKKWVNLLFMLFLVLGIIIAPLALPLLPVKAFIEFNQTLGLTPANTESKELSELPQHYADRFGWENMAKQVSEVYESLPDSLIDKAVVFTQNYGEAAALEYYQKKYPLPPVLCLHNNYWLWGWKQTEKSLDTVLLLGGKREDHIDNFESVEPVTIIRCRYCMPYENNLTLFLCKHLIDDFRDIWNKEKHFI